MFVMAACEAIKIVQTLTLVIKLHPSAPNSYLEGTKVNQQLKKFNKKIGTTRLHAYVNAKRNKTKDTNISFKMNSCKIMGIRSPR